MIELQKLGLEVRHFPLQGAIARACLTPETIVDRGVHLVLEVESATASRSLLSLWRCGLGALGDGAEGEGRQNLRRDELRL
jgi:hypothetical protein